MVAAAGDVACDPTDPAYNGGAGSPGACHTEATAALLDQLQPDAILGVGDLQEDQGTLQQYLAVYDPTWGRHKDVTHPVVGNHDYYLYPDARGYFDYWGPAAGERLEGWYSFDVGTWHVVALNSNCAAVGGCGPGSPQETWLRADLAASSASCTVAFFHHPRFSSRYGVNDTVLGLWQALHDSGVEVAVSGHGHHYERFAPTDVVGDVDSGRGVRQFVAGTGGQSHHKFRNVLPASEVRDNTTYGILVLTLRPGAYDWEFVPEAGGTFTDSGSTSCH
ncbi:MAG: metallophosphoesterase [Actinobacteria bacterium]|nr:metallophosphoesterase [Actinomycetota bacterium]